MTLPTAFAGRPKTLILRFVFALAFGLLAWLPVSSYAQGDGPKAQNQLPINTWVLVPTYLHQYGDYNFAGTIMLPGADVRANIGGLSFLRAFNLGGRYAQIYMTPIYGRVSGDVSVFDPALGADVTRSFGKSGFSDPFVIFKYGLVGLEPQTGAEMAKAGNAKFQLGVSAGVSIPIGQYDSDDLLNLGTNVWSLRLGAPMMIPLGTPQGGFVKTHLEMTPSVTFFSDNDDPTLNASTREQDPLFGLEAHLLHDFNQKWWGSLDMLYQNGGETITDGIEDDNRQNAFGGGVTLSYAFTPRVSLQGTYGAILSSTSDDADLTRYRLKMVIVL